jgi:hypothetical protein
MAPEFLDELASVISKAGGRRTAILGMHLCGLLRYGRTSTCVVVPTRANQSPLLLPYDV